MKRTVSVLLCVLMLLSAVSFSASAEASKTLDSTRQDVGTIRNFTGIIECDAVKDEAYDRFANKIALDIGETADSTAMSYWLFSDDYKTLNVFIEATDAMLDDQKYYDDNGKEIYIFNDYFLGNNVNFDESLYTYEDGRMTSEEKPYETASEACNADRKNGLFWHSDGVEIWINPTNIMHTKAETTEMANQGYHYKCDIRGEKNCYIMYSNFYDEDCDQFFEAKVNVYERDEKTGKGKYYMEFSIDASWFNSTSFPKMDYDESAYPVTKTESTKKVNRGTYRAEMAEGVVIGIGCQMVEHVWKQSQIWIGSQRAAEERWTLTSLYLHGTNSGTMYLLSAHPQATLGGSVGFDDCEEDGEEHDWKDIGTAATCQTDGYSELVCRRCGAKQERVEIPADAKYHVEKEGTRQVIREADCKTEGEYTYECSVCNQTVTVTTEKLEHKYEDGECIYCHEEEPITVAFDDVKSGWYYDSVMYVVKKGAMAGTGNNLFEPTKVLDRSQFCQVLYNLEGKPETDVTSTGFNDVASGAWYAKAVKWANVNGVVSGTGNGNFSPTAPITREQICTMLYRYLYTFHDYEIATTPSTVTFADADKVSSWAKTAVENMRDTGFVTGISEGGAMYYKPAKEASRAEIAVILERVLKALASR